jgi:alkaline phosphatase D
MSRNLKKLTFISLVAVLILGSCGEKSVDGPFFGNGFHNGWADQTSAVIWTRLTKNPQLNSNGQKFLIPISDEKKSLKKSGNNDSLNMAQIPQGFVLDQMEGACPGTPGEVKLMYYPLSDSSQKFETGWVAVDAGKNFTIQWKLDFLMPGTKYVVHLDARPIGKKIISDKVDGTFSTPPTEKMAENIEFCIVTCHDYARRDDPVNGHKIYPVMLRMSPDFFVHTGDVEYYDHKEPFAYTEELMRFKWDRLFALPFQRDFYKQVTTYFMKDDHDVLSDDAFPGKTYGAVSWERGLEIFDKEQFPSNDKPYKTVRWGKNLQIWMVEGRNFRSKNSDPDGPGKTIWGKEQKEWLFKTLQESDATFKLLITPGPILGPDRDKKKDNYSNSNWKFEGDEIRSFLNKFDNVFICNGDRHWQYVSHPQNTNLWEFSCGAGSDVHAGGWPPDDKRPEHRFLRVMGGFLKGSVKHEKDTIVLKFQHFDVDGNEVHQEVFRRKN